MQNKSGECFANKKWQNKKWKQQKKKHLLSFVQVMWRQENVHFNESDGMIRKVLEEWEKIQEYGKCILFRLAKK